nr:hypothetical protein [Streptomonospora nanhaiensis]
MVQQANVQLGRRQQPHLLGGRQLLEVHLQAGRPLRQGLQQRPQHRRGGVGGHPGAQRAQLAVAGLAHHRAQPLLAQQQRAGLVAQQPAGGGELDGAARPVEQRHPQFPLQALDGLAERRLGDPQRLGGAAEVHLLGHGEEVAQVAGQVHGAPA